MNKIIQVLFNKTFNSIEINDYTLKDLIDKMLNNNISLLFSQISSDTLLDESYKVIEATSALTITLPPAKGIEGREYKISNSSIGTITINDNTDTLVASLTTQGESISLISNGTTWLIF